MHLTQLQISNFRNILHADLELLPDINLIAGPNGSGKTSFLEAIYYLALGKSFRTHLHNRVIHEQADQLIISGKLLQMNAIELSVGISRNRNGQSLIRLSEQNVESVARIAELLPIQLIHPQSYLLLDGGPEPRRQFIDWGLFHVEHQFLDCWKRFYKTLRQRNAALRGGLHLREVEVWNSEFIAEGERLTERRFQYIDRIKNTIHEMLERLLGKSMKFDIQFYQGWDKNSSLTKCLDQNIRRDRELRYTTSGPHRADMKLVFKNMPVQDVLSRGQQKLLIFALKLAQVDWMSRQTNKRCLFLIDDIPSELDDTHKQRLSGLLNGLGGQLFITGIESTSLALFSKNRVSKMFHVEHGRFL